MNDRRTPTRKDGSTWAQSRHALGGASQGLRDDRQPDLRDRGGAAGGSPAARAAALISGLGGFDNGLTSLITAGFLRGTQALDAQNMMFQLQLQSQSQQFDEMTSEKSELMREQNELRNVAMEQRKADNEITKAVHQDDRLMLVPQLLRPRRPAGRRRRAQSPPGARHRTTPRGRRAGTDRAVELRAAPARAEFDLAMKGRAEAEREANVLRDMAMAQLKKDDENMQEMDRHDLSRAKERGPRHRHLAHERPPATRPFR